MKSASKRQVIWVSGLPREEQNVSHATVLRTRVNTAWQHYLEQTKLKDATLYASTSSLAVDPRTASEMRSDRSSNERSIGISVEERARQYKAQAPNYTMSRLILPENTRRHLILASQAITLEKQVYDDWGIRSIEPFPRSALNFYGPPGTGKSLAAHALASHLDCDILLASYADIESMYHGEGPKNVDAVFRAAERDKALLFIDEADSLLSKRLTNVTQGSEQAINSMRSQLFICMERFRGVVVFATNLITNYDPAFESRVRSIEFPLPDRECRKRIWAEHIPSRLPLEVPEGVGELTDELADSADLCGREIRNAVVDAAFQAAERGQETVKKIDFMDAIKRVVSSRAIRREDVIVHDLTPDEQQAVANALGKAS